MIKKLLILKILVFMLCISLFQGCITTTEKEPFVFDKNSIYVSVDGTKNFTSIQEAIDYAPENFNIIILSGQYHENIHINKSVTITGENPKTTIIIGSSSYNTVVIDGSNVTLSNCSIINSGTNGNDAGIKILTDHVQIYNNIIYNNNNGIYTSRAENNNIRNNIIKNNSVYGIYAYSGSNHMNITNNVFFHNDVSLRIKGSQYCTVSKNQFNDSNKGMYFCCGARNNMAYQNNFINHSIWNGDDQAGTNGWNDTLQGNYWDDYIGIDVDNDGIGDEPYNIEKVLIIIH